MVSPTSASASASPSQDFFALQAEKHRAAKAKEAAAVEAAETTVATEFQDTVQLMPTFDNETFLALGASNAKIPREFLRSSAGVNHFFQRFFLETNMISETTGHKLITETESWTAALEERGTYQTPVDLELTNMWLSDTRLEKLAKALPNVRSLTVKGFVYFAHDSKTNALNIEALLKARFPQLKKIEIKGGYLLPNLQEKIKLAVPAMAVYDIIKGLKRAEDLRLYYPNITHDKARELYREVQEFPANPKVQFCKNKVMNLIIEDLLNKKSPLMKKIEPIVFGVEKKAAESAPAADKPEADKLAADKPAADKPEADKLAADKPADNGEWAAPVLADWERDAAKPAVDDWA